MENNFATLQGLLPVELSGTHLLDFLDETLAYIGIATPTGSNLLAVDQLSAMDSLLKGLTPRASSLEGNLDRETMYSEPCDDSAQSQGAPVNQSKGTRRPTTKETLANLDREAAKLTNTLKTLEAKKSRRMLRAASDESSRSPAATMWEEIAHRQQERRRKAELENDTLRQMLTLQRQEAASLRRFLKRRFRMKMMQDLLRVQRSSGILFPSTSLVPADNTQVIQKILYECDELHAGVDKLLRDRDILDLPCSAQKRICERDVIEGTLLDVKQRSRVPFGVQDTARAIWAVLGETRRPVQEKLHNYDKGIHFHPQQSEEESDTKIASYFAALAGFEGIGISGAQMRKVMRKHIQDESRVVFVGQTLMESKLLGGVESAGFRLKVGWQIVVQEDARGSQIIIHFNASRIDLKMPISPRYRVPGNLDVPISVWSDLMMRIPETVENVLVDESLNDPRNELKMS